LFSFHGVRTNVFALLVEEGGACELRRVPGYLRVFERESDSLLDVAWYPDLPESLDPHPPVTTRTRFVPVPNVRAYRLSPSGVSVAQVWIDETCCGALPSELTLPADWHLVAL
jgi:hypothetical protein